MRDGVKLETVHYAPILGRSVRPAAGAQYHRRLRRNRRPVDRRRRAEDPYLPAGGTRPLSNAAHARALRLSRLRDRRRGLCRAGLQLRHAGLPRHRRIERRVRSAAPRARGRAGYARLARRQPWYDGRLGVTGPCYLGYAQWAICDALPEVSAMATQVSSAEFQSIVFPGGSFSLQLWLSWLQIVEGLTETPLTAGCRS